MTDLSQKTGPVIEVGCGPGLHSETIATAFLKGEGSVLVSCDFSSNMISMLNERYTSPDCKYSQLAGNKVFVNTVNDYADPANTDKVNLSSII